MSRRPRIGLRWAAVAGAAVLLVACAGPVSTPAAAPPTAAPPAPAQPAPAAAPAPQPLSAPAAAMQPAPAAQTNDLSTREGRMNEALKNYEASKAAPADAASAPVKTKPKGRKQAPKAPAKAASSAQR